MKKRGFFNQFIFFINSVFAVFLLLSIGVAYIPPQQLPFIALLSLVVSMLLIINVLFLVYWLVRLRRELFLSLVVLLLCVVQYNSFYRFGKGEVPSAQNNQLKVMNFNVRLFNVYDWIKDPTIPHQIAQFIAETKPDVISFQEYSHNEAVSLAEYPHSYIHLVKEKPPFGQAIYSKYPIIHKGSLGFKNTANNAIFVDIIKNNDTLRVYNVHLESMQVHESDVDFNQENSKRLLRRMAQSFQKQEEQVHLLTTHLENTHHKAILMADLNNTAFSYVYRTLKGSKKDAFAQRGTGLGSTFLFKKIPLRIDFIFADPKFSILEFDTHQKELSDHFPISAVLSWE